MTAHGDMVRWRVEAQAFPLTSPAAFQQGLVALSHARPGVLDEPTRRVSEALEDWMRPRLDGLSLEVLRRLREQAWFPERQQQVDLHEHVLGLARSCLRLQGGRVGLREDGERAAAMLRWRWLSIYLPPDLLVATLGAAQGVVPLEDDVDLLTPTVREVMRGPCAETHLHVGAALSFSVLWTGLSRSLADREQAMEFRPTRALSLPFGGDVGLMQTMLAAMITRLLLGSMMQWHERQGRGDLATFVNSPLDHIARRLSWAWGDQAAHRLLLGVLRSLMTAGPLPPVALLRLLYRRLIGWTRGAPARDLSELAAQDPLSRWSLADTRALPELSFAARALVHLRRQTQQGHPDEMFQRCFWQYQRVRCQVFRMLVQEPGTAGLDWFTQFFYRISPLRSAIEGIKYHAALVTQSRGIHLASLEVRTAPASLWTGVRDEVRALARQAARFHAPEARGRSEVGLVLHFIKAWEGRGVAHADPRNPVSRCRHGAWFRERWREARAILRALDHLPELLLVLRGIDVANVELAQPGWVVALLLQQVRAGSTQAAHRAQLLHPSWQVSPLRITCHAGEDYRRLTEGLRLVHEAIEFGTLRLGDRLGHALVVGEDASLLQKSHPEAVQPAEERLDDLLWELDRYARGELTVTGRRFPVEEEARGLGQRIYGAEGADLGVLREARRLRFDRELLLAWGYPFLRPERAVEGRGANRRARALLDRYLTDAGVYERGQWPVTVEFTEDEARMVSEAQQLVRRQLGQLEITIESNPSSNLLIANLTAPEAHPLFRLSPLPGRPGVGDPVMLSVNTDNPITFTSCLGDEFAHTYHALLRQGVGSQEASAWLERVREAGFRSRFTLAASRSRAALRSISARRTRGRP